jgi:glycosyltransferase involved in cell wall biosynthesis
MADRPTGILYLIDILYDNAGTENNLFQVVTLLDKRRFRPVVCPLEPLSSPMITRMQEAGIRVEPLGVARSWDGRAFAAARRVRRLVREENIALIQSIHFGSDLFTALWRRMWGKTVWISSRRDMGFSESHPLHLRLRRMMNPAVSRTLTNSQLMRATIAEREALPLERIGTIYNGVEIPPAEARQNRAALARENGLDPALPIIGCVANWRPVKGLEFLLEAFASLLREQPGLQLVLIGGDADSLHRGSADAYRARLEQLITENRMAGRIRRLGRRDDVVALLPMMDLFVLPSLSEGFSNALLEAMAAGLPVVTTAVGGNPEAVIHDECGILVPPADAGALAREMGRLLDDQALRQRLGQAARDRVRKQFSTSAMIETLQDVYAECLHGLGR